MIDIAQKYTSFGLSVIPIGDSKLPIGSWKESQNKIIVPNENFVSNKLKGIGIVCGKVSDNLECIDIDEKYSLDKKLFTEYKKAISELDKQLLKKLVVQKTPSGGYHFLYKCKTIEGNKKLAQRFVSDEEKAINVKEKTKVLIETRGEGGYFMCAPSEGYEIIYGSFDKINEISTEEREILFDCAKIFNSVYKEPYIKKEQKKIIEENISPFDEYNNKGDVLDFLISEGWKITLKRGSKNLLLRPSGTGKWSADWDEDKRLFYVFSSSTEFENEKAYNASQVLTTIKFNGDYSESAKWLLKNGFGNFTPTKKDKAEFKPLEVKSSVSLEDDDYSFLATDEECDLYITQKRNGTFKMGNTTGFPSFDKYFRFKKGQLDMILGHDNAGKSIVSWYFSVLDCVYNNENYIIFAGENKTGAVKSRIIEFYTGKSIVSLTDSEFKRANVWFKEHYALIRNDEVFSYLDMLNIGRKMLKRKKYTKFIIEPYNVLNKPHTNEHQYDYKAMIDIRMFILETGIGVLLNVHAATEALRKVYAKEHEWAGYAMPPNKSDAEGGGKFPNKADNFIVIHRMADHPSEKVWTEIHVQKIKEYETGGQRTNKFEPYKIRMIDGGCGFTDSNHYDPIQVYWSTQGKQTELPISEKSAIQPNIEFNKIKPLVEKNWEDEMDEFQRNY